MPDFRCAAVVLAAGASTRLGQPKQLVLIHGESLLHRTARLVVEAACSPVFVVVGFEASRMREYVEDLPVVTVLNAAWQQGMGSSLRAGMEALAGTEPLPEAVLLTVCDQPGLAAEHLRELLARHAAAQSACKCTITASSYAERYGVPAVFSATMFTELSAASGDRGARDLILAHRSQVQGIPWPAGVLDIDRPEDLGTIEP